MNSGSSSMNMVKSDHISGEPTLEEVLGDPIVKLLMAFDGIGQEELRPILDAISNQIQ